MRSLVGYVQTQPERGRFVVLKECYKNVPFANFAWVGHVQTA